MAVLSHERNCWHGNGRLRAAQQACYELMLRPNLIVVAVAGFWAAFFWPGATRLSMTIGFRTLPAVRQPMR
jgi:hypothetical protein